MEVDNNGVALVAYRDQAIVLGHSDVNDDIFFATRMGNNARNDLSIRGLGQFGTNAASNATGVNYNGITIDTGGSKDSRQALSSNVGISLYVNTVRNGDVIFGRGKIGVGTMAPACELDVNGALACTSATSSNFRALTTSATAGGPWLWSHDDTRVRGYMYSNSGMVWSAYEGGAHEFRNTSNGNVTAPFLIYRDYVTVPLTQAGSCRFGSSSLIPGADGIVNVTGVANTKSALNTYLAAATTQTHVAFYNTNGRVGAISTLNSATTYSTTSDYRVKTNVKPYDSSEAIVSVRNMKPVTFSFVSEGSNAGPTHGFIAHELQAVCPEAVVGEKDAVGEADGAPVLQSVDYGRITPVLTAALKALVESVDRIDARLSVLEQKNHL